MQPWGPEALRMNALVNGATHPVGGNMFWLEAWRLSHEYERSVELAFSHGSETNSLDVVTQI